MISFPLGAWFRRRMIPMVVLVGVALTVAAPLAYHLQRRRDLAASAHADAKRAARIVQELARERPGLWLYSGGKLQERLLEEGLGPAPALVIQDLHGKSVELDGQALPPRPLWARAEVEMEGQVVGHVWAAGDLGLVWSRTGALAALCALAATLISLLLFLIPQRALRSAEERIQLLSGKLAVTVQESERRRIARDLHDGVGQTLTAARLHLLALEGQGVPPEATRAIAHHLDEATAEVRRAIAALIPPAVSELGLRQALARHCEAFGSASRLAIVYEAPDPLPRLEPEIETACFRIVQEALTNAARHAGATEVNVRLETGPGELRLSILDDGRGLASSERAGHGLEFIAERARLLGGSLSVPDVARGTQLSVRFPLVEESR